MAIVNLNLLLGQLRVRVCARTGRRRVRSVLTHALRRTCLLSNSDGVATWSSGCNVATCAGGYGEYVNSCQSC